MHVKIIDEYAWALLAHTLIEYTVECVLSVGSAFYLANIEMPNQNGILDILNHMVRPRNTHVHMAKHMEL